MKRLIIMSHVLLTFCLAELQGIHGTITYITSDQVYCDIGKEDGLMVNDTLTVFRRTEEIGKLIVSHLSKGNSVCVSLVPTTLYQLGDRVSGNIQLQQKDTESLIDSVFAPENITTEVPKQTKQLIEQDGKIGYRFSRVSYSSSSSSNRQVSTLQYGIRIGSSLPVSAWMYGRGTDTHETFSVYQARIQLGSSEGSLYSQIGRVFTYELSGMGVTDGLLIKWKPKEKIGTGIVVGAQPDPVTLSFNSSVKKFGLFSDWETRLKSISLSNRTALVGQYADGKADREFAVIQFRIGTRSIWDVRSNTIIDYYQNLGGINRDPVTVTNNELSLRVKTRFGLTMATRFSSNRRVLYQTTNTTFTDSLFEDELRSGWYSSLQYSHPVIGRLIAGYNIRIGSTDRPSTLTRVSYGTGSYLKKFYGDVSLAFLQNSLISGLRSQVGIGRGVGPFSVYGEIEDFAYGYGKNMSDYHQVTTSMSIHLKLRRRFSVSSSFDYMIENDFSMLYVYAGVMVRF